MSALISLKRILYDFDSKHKTPTSGWREYAIRDWLPMALGLMGVRVTYDIGVTTKKATGHRVALPCQKQHMIAIIYEGYRLPVKNNIPSKYSQDYLKYPLAPVHRIDIYSHVGHTTFEEGDVTFIYLDYPKDEEGFILIPANEQLAEALYWYLLFQMLLSQNYKHPEINLQFAMQMWEIKRDVAINYLSFPDPEAMIRMTELVNNGLLYDIDKTFYEL